MSAFEPLPEEPEDVAGGPLVWTLALTVLMTLVGALVVWGLGADRLPIEFRGEVRRFDGMAPAGSFSLPTAAERERADALGELEHWTWADSRMRRVRLPVNVAIERYLALRGGR